LKSIELWQSVFVIRVKRKL